MLLRLPDINISWVVRRGSKGSLCTLADAWHPVGVITGVTAHKPYSDLKSVEVSLSVWLPLSLHSPVELQGHMKPICLGVGCSHSRLTAHSQFTD